MTTTLPRSSLQVLESARANTKEVLMFTRTKLFVFSMALASSLLLAQMAEASMYRGG
jgi:hypothetical protein